MASYAPLLVNNNNRRWNPDAIVFNSSVWYGTPSYWNQVECGAVDKLFDFSKVIFSDNRGVKLLNSSFSSSNVTVVASVTCGDTACMKVKLLVVINGNACQRLLLH